MFKKKTEIRFGSCNKRYIVENEVANHIDKLEKDLRNMKYGMDDWRQKSYELQRELDAIKPIVQNKNYEPAISKDCRDCIYVIKSPYSGEILGCRKNNVCGDFKEKE